jgi:NTP pyrophosphatase (non-canonical NTP hydrolase)
MDEQETVATLKQRAIDFRDRRNWAQFHSPKELTIGLSIECAELQELFLWKSEEEVREVLRDEQGRRRVKEELADVFVFLLYLSQGCGIDLSDALTEKLAINEQKYPVGRCFGSNKKYNELNHSNQ